MKARTLKQHLRVKERRTGPHGWLRSALENGIERYRQLPFDTSEAAIWSGVVCAACFLVSVLTSTFPLSGKWALCGVLALSLCGVFLLVTRYLRNQAGLQEALIRLQEQERMEVEHERLQQEAMSGIS